MHGYFSSTYLHVHSIANIDNKIHNYSGNFFKYAVHSQIKSAVPQTYAKISIKIYSYLNIYMIHFTYCILIDSLSNILKSKNDLIELLIPASISGPADQS